MIHFKNCSIITLHLISLSSFALLVACHDNDPSPTRPLGFGSLFDEYLKPQCAQEACHGGERGVAGLRFMERDEAYFALIDQPPTNAPAREAGLKLVVPGDLESSLLWHKLSSSAEELSTHSYGAVMPLTGGQKAGPNTLSAFREWIMSGAPLEGSSASALGIEFDAHPRTEDVAYVNCQLSVEPTEEEMRACFSPPQTESTLRLYTPILSIPPHSESLICSYLEMPIDAPIYLNRTLGQQMNGGHHAAVFLAVSPSHEAPHECRDDEMSNFRFAAGAGGGGGQDTQLPPGVALKIEPGQQFVIQSHYLNTSDRPMKVMDAVDLVPLSESSVTARVDPFAMIYGDLEIPADGMPFEVNKRCRLERDIDIYMLLGHTHDYGVLFEVYYHSPMLEHPRKLYHATDGPLLRDNPEIKYFDPPLPFKAGDEIEMRCVWENESDLPLGWPEEMCVALMYYGPGEGWMTCDEDDETPKLPSAGGEGCVASNEQGNELGVGRACTASGGECSSNERATLCLATFDSRANFCSYLGCEQDEDCGVGAQCLEQGPATACVPLSCAHDK